MSCWARRNLTFPLERCSEVDSSVAAGVTCTPLPCTTRAGLSALFSKGPSQKGPEGDEKQGPCVGYY